MLFGITQDSIRFSIRHPQIPLQKLVLGERRGGDFIILLLVLVQQPMTLQLGGGPTRDFFYGKGVGVFMRRHKPCWVRATEGTQR